jgi:SAM-dependent methyltransferase
MGRLLKDIDQYYSDKIKKFGATPQGVDWKDEASQKIRFRQLLKILHQRRDFSLNDLGCGYGSLLGYMIESGFESFQFCGYDLSEEMIAQAGLLFKGAENNSFKRITDSNQLAPADYTVASGIFNVKMEYEEKEWMDYFLATLNNMNVVSQKGFSFNALTKYSDKEFMKDNLYYADPLFIFDYCKTHFSKHVSLIHDYPLYEFTILVKK